MIAAIVFSLLTSVHGSPVADAREDCESRMTSGRMVRILAAARLTIPRRLGFVDDAAYARVLDRVHLEMNARFASSNEDRWLIDLDSIYPLGRDRSIAYFYGLGTRNLRAIDLAFEFDRRTGEVGDVRITAGPRDETAREAKPESVAVPNRLLKTIQYHAARDHQLLGLQAYMSDRHRERVRRMNHADVRRTYRVGAGESIYVELSVTSYFEDGGSGQLVDHTNRLVYTLATDGTIKFRASDSGRLDELIRLQL